MKTLLRILYILLAILILLLIVGLFLPSRKHFGSTITIHAPDSVVFKQVNNLKNWGKWSPWNTNDSTVKMTYPGPDAGEGAESHWQSALMGNVSMTITGSNPYKNLQLNFNFNGRGIAQSPWTFRQQADGTIVTWYLDVSGLRYPEGRYMGLFFKSWMTPMFTDGLYNLKKVSEEIAGKSK